MAKTNVSATVDEDVAEYLQQDSVNASGLINRLVKDYMNGGGSEMAMLRLRLEQVEGDIDSAENDLDSLREQRRRIRERLDEAREEEREAYESRLAEAATHIRVEQLNSDPEPRVAEPDGHVESIADSFDVDEQDLREKALEEYDA